MNRKGEEVFGYKSSSTKLWQSRLKGRYEEAVSIASPVVAESQEEALLTDAFSATPDPAPITSAAPVGVCLMAVQRRLAQMSQKWSTS